MKILRHNENFVRQASQLRTTIDDLKRGVLLLEADITAAMKLNRSADPAKSTYHIATGSLKERRDNLARTIWSLEGRLAEIGSAPLKQSDSEKSHVRA